MMSATERRAAIAQGIDSVTFFYPKKASTLLIEALKVYAGRRFPIDLYVRVIKSEGDSPNAEYMANYRLDMGEAQEERARQALTLDADHILDRAAFIDAAGRYINRMFIAIDTRRRNKNESSQRAVRAFIDTRLAAMFPGAKHTLNFDGSGLGVSEHCTSGIDAACILNANAFQSAGVFPSIVQAYQVAVSNFLVYFVAAEC